MDISIKSLEEAVGIRRQIATLEKRFASLLGASPATTSSRRGKRRMSVQARAKIAAAMRARWAKRKGTAATVSTHRKKGGLTPAGRRRLSLLMKARWAARRKASGKK
jgi:hypothetical protein